MDDSGSNQQRMPSKKIKKKTGKKLERKDSVKSSTSSIMPLGMGAKSPKKSSIGSGKSSISSSISRSPTRSKRIDTDKLLLSSPLPTIMQKVKTVGKKADPKHHLKNMHSEQSFMPQPLSNQNSSLPPEKKEFSKSPSRTMVHFGGEKQTGEN